MKNDERRTKGRGRLFESVVTVAVRSFSRYTKRLSDEVMRCRGPVPAFSWTTGGVFAVSRPLFSSNRNWKI